MKERDQNKQEVPPAQGLEEGGDHSLALVYSVTLDGLEKGSIIRSI